MTQKEIYEMHPLFEEVQMNCIFTDGKTFVDCIPKVSTELILQQYLQQKGDPGFILKDFILTHFHLPHVFAGDYHTVSTQSVTEHIQALWPILTRMPDEKNGSLIPLPNSYIVPGGRFGEVYYRDSYFTMLGLKASGMVEMIENMIKPAGMIIMAVANGNHVQRTGANAKQTEVVNDR